MIFLLRRFTRLALSASVLLAGVQISAIAQSEPPGREEALAEFRSGVALAMQADMAGAMTHLRKIQPDQLDPRRRGMLTAVLARFAPGAPPPKATGVDDWTAQVIDAYRHYWTRVMLREVTAQKGERELIQALSPLAGGNGRSLSDMPAIEARLKAQLQQRGYFALAGVTSPLREFMLWRKQEDVTYSVNLPEAKQSVAVAMLDDFVSFGWLGYATLDIQHTGGWTTAEKLFCVRSGYDLESEAFRVSYLAHEGQHFRDGRLFPKLEQPELEYRAKLVEIAMADTTLVALLQAFSGNQSDARDRPHSFANRKLIEDLSRAPEILAVKAKNSPPAEWWIGIAPEILHATATRLLIEDSKNLGRSQPGRRE